MALLLTGLTTTAVLQGNFREMKCYLMFAGKSVWMRCAVWNQRCLKQCCIEWYPKNNSATAESSLQVQKYTLFKDSIPGDKDDIIWP